MNISRGVKGVAFHSEEVMNLPRGNQPRMKPKSQSTTMANHG